MGISIAMVTLSKSDPVSPQALAQSLKSDWPETTLDDLKVEDSVISFLVGESTAFIGHMPAPIPWSDLEEACATSVLWPDAEVSLRSHEMHLIVTVTAELSALARAKLLTQIVTVQVALSYHGIGDLISKYVGERFKDIAFLFA